MSLEKFSRRAIQWLRERLPSETGQDRASKSRLPDSPGLQGLQLRADEAEIDWQSGAFDYEVSFQEALSGIIDHFLRGADSSTSLADVAAMKGVLPAGSDPEEIQACLHDLLGQATLFLFPADYIDLIEKQALPFHRPDYTRSVRDYWTFGLLVPRLAPWEFIGFVGRRAPAEAYHTGYLAPAGEDAST